MAPLSICINTQTPLVQFLDDPERGRLLPKDGVNLATLQDGVDYRYSPGGVTRMVYPLVRRLLEKGILDEAHWVSLNPRAPATAHLGPMTLHHVALDPEQMTGYAAVKEAIWGRVHEIDANDRNEQLFWTEAFAAYEFYNRSTAELIRRLDAKHNFDTFYVHDFQQMPVGHMLGTLKPKVFRWHIPFDATTIPEEWRALLATYLHAYDVLVVSAERYATSLRELAPKAQVVRYYPYVDPSDYTRPDAATVAAVAARLGLPARADVALLVARMDPIKGQDLAIRAVAALAPEFPRLRLVLVGNGSFSGSKAGLGLSKSARWRAHLEEVVQSLALADRVVFTGHLPQPELDALYERCRFTVMPSVREGFGLVAVESWLHGRPAIVTDRAGISELIRDGENGLLFDPDDPDALVHAMRRLLDTGSGPLRRRLARNGLATSHECSVEAAERAERALLAPPVEAS